MERKVKGSQNGYNDLHEWYVQERRLLIEGERSQSDLFDKSILTIASGAFAISLGVVSGSIGSKNLVYIWALALSWVLFGVCIVLTLISFLTSQHAYVSQVEKLEADYTSITKRDTLLEGEGSAESPSDGVKNNKNRAKAITGYLNTGSLLSFIVALMLLGFFVILNIV